MKLYQSDSDLSLNGHAPETDEREPSEEDEQLEFDYSTLFEAPNLADFIKTPPNTKSRIYERKVASLMKAGFVMSINNELIPDAATFLKYGPGVAKAAGNLAAEDERAAKIINMLTAPDNVYAMMVMVSMPFVAQLIRNHKTDVEYGAQSFREKRALRKQQKKEGLRPTVKPIVVKLPRGRSITLPIRFRLRLPSFKGMFRMFLAPTQFPNEIAQEVFSDPAVQRAMNKMGVFARGSQRSDNAA